MELTVKMEVDDEEAILAMKRLNMNKDEFQDAFRKFVELEFMAFMRGVPEDVAEGIDRLGKASAWEKLREKYLR